MLTTLIIGYENAVWGYMKEHLRALWMELLREWMSILCLLLQGQVDNLT